MSGRALLFVLVLNYIWSLYEVRDNEPEFPTIIKKGYKNCTDWTLVFQTLFRISSMQRCLEQNIRFRRNVHRHSRCCSALHTAPLQSAVLYCSALCSLTRYPELCTETTGLMLMRPAARRTVRRRQKDNRDRQQPRRSRSPPRRRRSRSRSPPRRRYCWNNELPHVQNICYIKTCLE